MTVDIRKVAEMVVDSRSGRDLGFWGRAFTSPAERLITLAIYQLARIEDRLERLERAAR